MGLADWWSQQQHFHHTSSHALAVVSPMSATDANNMSKPSSVTTIECDGNVSGLYRVVSSSASQKTRPVLRAYTSTHVASKPFGLFQQVLSAKFFFSKTTRSQLQRTDASLDTTAPSDSADANVECALRRTPSRLRSFFSRTTAIESPLEATASPVPATWLVSEASTDLDALVQSALANNTAQLQLTTDGCGGAYFVQPDTSRFKKPAPLGIFKPRDEEYMAPSNPRGYVVDSAVVGETENPVNKGFRIGNGALRERAAYLLDAAYGGFSGVPVTNVVSLNVSGTLKEGSLQQFVASECSAEDMGTLKFAIPEVHKIGILDVRLFNTDRHAGNILLATRPDEQTYSMTPIDHGFCLPSYKHLDAATFDWLHWPQAQFPFTGAELDHIASLDVDRDARMLLALGIERECVATMRMSTTFLQLGADAGYSLFEIASCLQRDGDCSTPSAFEALVSAAIASQQQSSGDVDIDAMVADVERGAAVLFTQLPKKKVRSISCFS